MKPLTAKEKAYELYNKVAKHAHANVFSFRAESHNTSCKKLATIVVDEMLDLYNKDFQDKQDKTYWHPYDYWLQVKEEISLIPPINN